MQLEADTSHSRVAQTNFHPGCSRRIGPCVHNSASTSIPGGWSNRRNPCQALGILPTKTHRFSSSENVNSIESSRGFTRRNTVHNLLHKTGAIFPPSLSSRRLSRDAHQGTALRQETRQGSEVCWEFQQRGYHKASPWAGADLSVELWLFHTLHSCPLATAELNTVGG